MPSALPSISALPLFLLPRTLMDAPANTSPYCFSELASRRGASRRSRCEPPVLGTLALALFVFAGCAVGALADTWMQFAPQGPAVLFPPYAILTAALLQSPARHWWIYLLAAALGDFFPHRGDAPTSFVLLAEAANFTRAIVAALGIRHFDDSRGRFDTLQGMTALLLFGVALAPAAAANVGAAVVLLHGRTDNFWLTWQQWFVSNSLTGLTLLPMLVIGARRWSQGVPAVLRTRPAEAALLASGLLAAGGYTFLGSQADTSDLPAQLYWPLPFLLWAAMRFGPGGTSAALLAVAGLAIGGAMRGRGPFVARSPVENLVQLQLFLMAMSVPLLLLAALVRQREHAEAERRQLEAHRQNALVLREIDRNKNEFLAILGHELRNPLNAMTLALELLHRPPPAGEGADWAEQVIGRQVAQMIRLVDDLLDVSRINRGQLRLQSETVELGTVIRQAVDTSRPLIQSRRHVLTVSLPQTPVHVRGDPVRLLQITANLLNNAAKYT